MPCEFHADARPPWEPAEKPRFSVVVVYEDKLTGVRAKHFYDSLIENIEDECDFSLEFLSFGVLASSEIRNSAARVAAQADFVIVSFRGKVGLPTEVKSWIQMWSRLIADRRAALIVLANKPRTKASTGASTLTYLRSIADRKGIAFFVHTVFSPANN